MRLIPSLLPLVLALALALVSPVQAASRPSSHPVPVVVTSFSSLSPRVGQLDTVSVHFIQGKQPLVGVPMVATVYLGSHTLLHLGPATTNRKGQALVRFRIPSSTAGQLLRVVTLLRYQHHLYQASNQLKVAGRKR